MEEIKLYFGNSYMNVIHFGAGNEKIVIISGVSLNGLEGQGDGVAQVYQTLAERYSIYLFERKNVLEKGYTVEDMANDIEQAMNKLGIEAAYVYGVSQGAMIAQVLAIKHPEKVKKLVLCSTMCRPTEKIKMVARKWLELAQNYDVVGLNRRFFVDVYSEDFLNAVKDLLPELEKVGTKEDCERFCILVKAVLNFDVYDEIEKIKCPVLVIGDRKDQTIGVEGSYEIIEKLGCKSYIYHQYSHAVYDEASDIKEKIKDFFSDSM